MPRQDNPRRAEAPENAPLAEPAGPSAASLARLPEENPYPVLRLSEAGVIVYANPASRALLEVWGAQPGEALPEPWLTGIREALAPQGSHTLDVTVAGRIFELYLSPSQEAGYINVYGRDVSERRRADAERDSLLRQVQAGRLLAEERAGQLEATLAAIADGIVICDTAGDLVTLNDVAERMFGYTDEERQLPLAERLRLLDARQADGTPYSLESAPIRRALRGETVHGAIMQLHPAGRPPLWVSVSAAPIHSPGGRISGAVMCLTDITAMRQSQIALEQANQELQAQAIELKQQKAELLRLASALASERERLGVTLASIADGVIATDAEGCVVLMNRAAEQLTGWPADSAIGLPLASVFTLVNERTGLPAEDPREPGVAPQEAGRSRAGLLLGRDGSRHPVTQSAAPIRDLDGNVIGTVLVFQDVSEQRRLEDELLRSNKLQALSLLAGGIAHDFNNLLTAIIGNIHLARLDVDPRSELGDLLEEAEKASSRAKDLTQQLLTFAKGGAPIKKSASLPELLCDSSAFAVRGSKAALELKLPDGLWPVEVDEGQISQVIQNLVINAEEAMPDGGTISIEAENVVVEDSEVPGLAPGHYVRVTVTDEGVGISEENLGRIFDPYFTTKTRGSGLGLATTYAIIKRHDGQISVRSQVGVGSAFSFYLPAAADRPQATEVAAQPCPEGKGAVLVMDDEPMVRKVAQRLLRRLGYQVDVASDGEAALAMYSVALAEGHPYAAVIMDLTVPGGMGGKEAMARLKEIDPDARAIVSSGYATDPVMADYASHGFAGVINKPYQLEDLARVLQQVLPPA